MIDTLNTRLAQKLRQRLNAEMEANLLQLGAGSAADFPDYKEKVGYLRAIKDVAEWIEDVEAEVLGKKRED